MHGAEGDGVGGLDSQLIDLQVLPGMAVSIVRSGLLHHLGSEDSRSSCPRQNTAVFNIQAVQGIESACLHFIRSTFSKMGNRESGE